MTGLLIRKQPCDNRDIQGQCHVTVKAEIGVMQLEARECQWLPANPQNPGGGKGGFPYMFQRETWPHRYLDFGLLASITVKQYVALRHPIFGTLLQQLQEINTASSKYSILLRALSGPQSSTLKCGRVHSSGCSEHPFWAVHFYRISCARSWFYWAR